MRIRPFEEKDEPGVLRVWEKCGLVVPQNDPSKDIRRKSRVNPEWFLVCEIDGVIAATCMAGYEGHRGWINYLAILSAHRRRGIAAALMAEVERLLHAAGCPKINLQIRSTNLAVVEFYESIGYSIEPVTSMGKRMEMDEPVNGSASLESRSATNGTDVSIPPLGRARRPRRAAGPIPAHPDASPHPPIRPTDPSARIGPSAKMELPPPPAGYASRMPYFEEASSLVSVGLDFHGRDAFFAPGTAAEWQEMKDAARSDGLELLMISGFRSHAWQAGLIARKLAGGVPLDEILRVNAYPGFSEHHTGRAIDIGSPASHELTEDFEDTPEFRWLSTNAHRFGFALSYPRDNSRGMIYEPWHWANSA